MFYCGSAESVTASKFAVRTVHWYTAVVCRSSSLCNGHVLQNAETFRRRLNVLQGYLIGFVTLHTHFFHFSSGSHYLTPVFLGFFSGDYAISCLSVLYMQWRNSTCCRINLGNSVLYVLLNQNWQKIANTDNSGLPPSISSPVGNKN